MAINATNYDGTKDYKIAEIGDVYHPNLLVNGDFQVNQRGTTSYSGVGYTVDMWRLMTSTSKLSVVSNGVNINGTNNELCQIIPDRIDITKATIALSINGTRYTHTFTGISSSYQNFSFGSVVVKIKNDSGNIYLHVNCSTAFTLNYVNLFEGDIAYPHVKEDYAIALYRCMRYFTRYGKNYSKTLGVGYVRNDHKIRFVYDFPVKMHSKPTVKLSGKMEFETEHQGYNTITSIIASEVSEDKCTISGTAGYDYVVGMNVTVYFSDHNLASYIDLSCEP